MVWAEKGAKIAQAAIDAGEEIPDTAVPPDLDAGLETYVSHFWELSTDRSIGFGCLGPIPWTSVDRYARQWCTTDVEYEDFLFFIRKLDTVFLELKNEKVSNS